MTRTAMRDRWVAPGLVAAAAALSFVAVGCKGKHSKQAPAPAAKTPAAKTPAPAAKTPAPAKSPAANAAAAKGPTAAQKAAIVAKAKSLWTDVHPAYKHWNAHTKKPVRGRQPHGAFIQAFYNNTVKKAIGGSGPWPDGSILVKDNYMPNKKKTGPGKLAIVTVMKKEGGTWFFAKFKPDGSLMKTPPTAKMPNMPIAGTKHLHCIGCHDNMGHRDHVITVLAANAK